jgi:hypothetical protein
MMIQRLPEHEVVQACQTLFGANVDVSRGFLFYLQPEGAKSAYRRKAKETHPDFFAGEDLRVQREQASLFRDVVRAYDVITLFFRQREKGLWLPPAGVHVPPSHDDPPHDTANTRENRPGRPGPQRPLPLRPMQLGHYLFYRGIITYRMLIEALVWQRKQRPVIGSLAMKWGWLSTEAIERILRSGGRMGRFGEKAVDLELLSTFQVKTLLYYQQSQQERLGMYFVRNNLLTREELDRLVRELDDHNARVRSAAFGRPVSRATR